MSRSNTQRNTRSDKSPLTLHKTGQYCKKIKGKFYYFGSDKEQALQRYLEQATYLHTGKGERPESNGDCILLKTLCNLYLDHQEIRTAVRCKNSSGRNIRNHEDLTDELIAEMGRGRCGSVRHNRPNPLINAARLPGA